MGTIRGIDISFQNDKNSNSGFGGNRDRFDSKMPPAKTNIPMVSVGSRLKIRTNLKMAKMKIDSLI
jgi:hypothetical protein